MPIGVQLMAKPFEEKALLSLSKLIESKNQ
jgi:Asp-tRNA(Asn)/Glu-tRNA(Gln) amidotransferase A subunit family amidase